MGPTLCGVAAAFGWGSSDLIARVTARRLGPVATMWGLSVAGSAIRFAGGSSRSFQLHRPTHGRTWWYGIGGSQDRVLVWGAGALLEFNGEEFVPFTPDATLEESERVPALSADGTSAALPRRGLQQVTD